MEDGTAEALMKVNESIGKISATLETVVDDVGKIKAKVFNGMSTNIKNTSEKVDRLIDLRRIDKQKEIEKKEVRKRGFDARTVVIGLIIACVVSIPDFVEMYSKYKGGVKIEKAE